MDDEAHLVPALQQPSTQKGYWLELTPSQNITQRKGTTFLLISLVFTQCCQTVRYAGMQKCGTALRSHAGLWPN